MDQRLSLVTLAVADLEATRRFYVDGLGWEPMIHVPGDVLMIKVADKVILSLWDRDHFEAEVGPIVTGSGVAPLTLAHNVGSREEVDQVLDDGARGGRGPGAGRQSTASGAATPATSATPTASAGRSPGRPATSARPCCPEALTGPRPVFSCRGRGRQVP